MKQSSDMRREIKQIPDRLDNMISASDNTILKSALKVRAQDPAFISTIARGSSDHAASYLKYVFELSTGLPVLSIGPSIASIYEAELRLENSVAFSISQSGKSPDIIRTTEMAGKCGATTVAITNQPLSPLAGICAHVFDIGAGEEKSVAATKTFMLSIVAGLLFIAYLKDDQDLLTAIRKLPDQAEDALCHDWSILKDRLLEKDSLYVIGRGPGMAIANEAALKFKETCRIDAQSYSSAEMMHGPKVVVDEDFTVLSFVTRDASERSVKTVSDTLANQGAKIFATTDHGVNASCLPFTASGHPYTDPLLLIISFYRFVEELARARGNNPDAPPHLKKVTETE